MKQEPNKVSKKEQTNPSLLPDIKSEYYRECLYCKISFTANHQLRRFCASKNGIPNYCKHRYKMLVQGARIAGENVVLGHKQDIPAPTVVHPEPRRAFDGELTKENIDTWQESIDVPNQETVLRNQKVIDGLLEKGKPKSFSIKTLIDSGLEFYAFSKRIQLPGCDLAYIEIGVYALFWTTKNEILITPITEILWM